MSDYQVLGVENRIEWLRELEKLEGLKPDLHYRPEYCYLYRDIGEPRLFIYREGKASILYPFLLRKVNRLPWFENDLYEELYDITSVYGYGGPIATSDVGEQKWANFRRCFDSFCAERRIITEFIRFHPLLGNHCRMEGLIEVQRASSVVQVDLRRSEEEIWREYEHNTRKNINKAYREGLEVLLEETPYRFEDYLSVYHHTLERNNAGEFYFFSREFYEMIHRDLPESFLYAHTIKDGRVVSTELLLYNQTYLHSFLGGTLRDFYSFRPNNILKHEVIKWAKRRGIEFFLLGGGCRDGDGIFQYKRSFYRRGVMDFYIGKKVHCPETMERLLNLISSSNCSDADYFPRYRCGEKNRGTIIRPGEGGCDEAYRT